MTDLSYRLDDFGRRLAIMEQELDELRRSTRPEPKPETPPVVRKPVTPPPSLRRGRRAPLRSPYAYAGRSTGPSCSEQRRSPGREAL